MSKNFFKTKNFFRQPVDENNEQGEKNKQTFEKFYNFQDFQKPVSVSKKAIWLCMGLAILAGFIAGCLCLVLFFSGILSGSKLFNWIDFKSLLPSDNIVIEKQEQVVVNEDERINTVVNQVEQSVVGIFDYRKPTGNLTQDVYLPENFLGNGFILTNDGWLVTSEGILSEKKEMVVVTAEGKILPIQEWKSDPQLKIVFLKVNEANLPTVSLAPWSAMELGERIVLLDGLKHYNQNILISRIINKEYQLSDKIIHTTETPYLFLSFSEQENTEHGLPAFDFEKRMVGLTMTNGNENYLVPASYIKKSFERLIAGSEKKPYLGVEYINLASVILSNYNKAGALITSIYKDSPLASINIKPGDIILQVDDDLINGNKNLTNLIQDYKTGDKVFLTILSKDDKKEVRLEVKLK